VSQVSTALQSNPGTGRIAPNTPSPSSLATAVPFGPAAPTRIGISIGRGGPKSGYCIIRIGAPFHSTCSPRSSPRNARM
jgi:hypothetical protein